MDFPLIVALKRIRYQPMNNRNLWYKVKSVSEKPRHTAEGVKNCSDLGKSGVRAASA